MEQEFRPKSEEKLETLREEALRQGRVKGEGAAVVGGPLPLSPAGYHGHSFLKSPVWTYYIPIYFFIGGLAGMSGVVALASWATTAGRPLVVTSLAIAVAGAAISALLLTLDLGRPRRFLNMLRVFKRRSPMSVGSWLITLYGAFSSAALGLAWFGAGRAWVWAATIPAAVLGSLVATYTGVLIGATAIPAWLTHRRFLPLHFGVAGLGSAASLLELLGFHQRSLHALALAAAVAETLLSIWQELVRKSPADRAIRTGKAGLLLWPGRVLAGPLTVVLRLVGLTTLASVSFLLGIFLNRWGWSFAGKESAREADAAFDVHGGDRGRTAGLAP